MDKFEWKEIAEQFISYPFLEPLHFTEQRDFLLPDAARRSPAQLASYLFSNRSKYKQFIRRKGRHPTLDMYACFQPFNEAFKALFNFVAYMQAQLAPDDIVLNLWDRSGWTASMLAGWFPEQRIWTMWEGDQDILGYKGFDYWMSPERRQRHTILFGDFNRPLPIASESIAAVVGFDLLHRFLQPDLLKEIHRVARPKAPVIFPHVHLTNNFPDPFFERGCRQLHGTDYAAMFAALQPVTRRTGYIMSEPHLFHHNEFAPVSPTPLSSESTHNDYNGCIAWLAADTHPFIQPWRGRTHHWQEQYLLQNPFLRINAQREIEWNKTLYGDQIDELLERHQVYKKRIGNTIGQTIPEKWLEILYWAGEGKMIGEIQTLTQVTEEELHAFLDTCWQMDLAQAVPVDETGFRLQTLLGQQRYLLEHKEQQLSVLWDQCVSLHRSGTWIKCADVALTYEQGDELMQLTRKALHNEGLQKGDHLLVCTGPHHETLIVFWAAVTLGAIVVPISPASSEQSILQYAQRMKPSMAFVDPRFRSVLSRIDNIKIFTTDKPDDNGYEGERSFEALLSMHIDDEETAWQPPNADDIAVILPTTGSTGNPKAIPLTHAQLIRSGRIMTETYHWKSADRYFSFGGLETMSGLRNATVSIAEVGATCVIAQQARSARDYAAAIIEQQATILAGNPLFFKQLLVAGKTKPGVKQFSSVRLALCTGNVLSAALRKEWRDKTSSVLLNYYGLTETSGICIAEPPGFFADDDRSIGLPVDCLVKSVDDAGRKMPPGTPGELCIYGAGNFRGYFENAAATGESLTRGWLRTKDLAIIHTDGSVVLCGRLSDIVKLPSGERIDIAAIEEVLMATDLADDWAVCPVQEFEKECVAVFFVPHDQQDPEETRAEIKKHIAEKIGLFAVPKIVAPVHTIPRGNHSKVLRKTLTDQLTQ